MLLFRCVICFQDPIAPAQTSGGVLAAWRTTALAEPSRENDALSAYASAAVAISSSPVHPFHEEPLGKPLVGIVVKPELPSTLAITPRRSVPLQVTDDGEAFNPGVRFRAAPPA